MTHTHCRRDSRTGSSVMGTSRHRTDTRAEARRPHASMRNADYRPMIAEM
jgi:hypothetical protein